MPLKILSIGSLKGPEAELCERYIKRALPLAKTLGFGKIEEISLNESKKGTSSERQKEEANRLLAKISDQAFVIALDERGGEMGSEAFAQQLQKARELTTEIVFLIGGADGLDDLLRQRAQLLLAFGKTTWPHQLVRAMIAEQIYRSCTLLAGHPYHRP